MPQHVPPRPSGSERRRWPRRGAEFPITLTYAGIRSEARVRDVSRSGVSFFLDRPIPLMTVLSLALSLGHGASRRTIQGQGAVVRCERISRAVEHYEVAVFLHDMGEEERAKLDAYVRTVSDT